jgi:dipeptidyl aminopeptidase/acylaminoacyl peptidase
MLKQSLYLLMRLPSIKSKFFCLCLVLLLSMNLFGQDGTIISSKSFELHDSVKQILIKSNPASAKVISDLIYTELIYLSDGLKVKAYMVEPKEKGKYPCIVANRGGNREFAKWDRMNAATHLGVMASWGYVVIASQYRGNDGGEGQEEFGGKDVNDVFNLVPVLGKVEKADTTRIGLEGGSRGGMMVYQIMRKSCRFKAAVVRAGAANAYVNIAARPGMENNLAQLIPNYWQNKDAELKKRSAVFWATEICKTTPLLLMHGSADWRVPLAESLELVGKLYEAKHPTRFIMFEGADHLLVDVAEDRYSASRKHFDKYLKRVSRYLT